VLSAWAGAAAAALAGAGRARRVGVPKEPGPGSAALALAARSGSTSASSGLIGSCMWRPFCLIGRIPRVSSPKRFRGACRIRVDVSTGPWSDAGLRPHCPVRTTGARCPAWIPRACHRRKEDACTRACWELERRELGCWESASPRSAPWPPRRRWRGVVPAPAIVASSPARRRVDTCGSSTAPLAAGRGRGSSPGTSAAPPVPPGPQVRPDSRESRVRKARRDPPDRRARKARRGRRGLLVRGSTPSTTSRAPLARARAVRRERSRSPRTRPTSSSFGASGRLRPRHPRHLRRPRHRHLHRLRRLRRSTS
jgi:hypothetical protein